MKKFGEGQQPFHAIIDIPEGDSQELTTVTDQALNSLYGELFNLLQTHGINPTTTTNADLKQVARAVWAAANASQLFIDSGTANVKNLVHCKGKSFLFRQGNSSDDGFVVEFLNKVENTAAVTINVFDVENNVNHFNNCPLLDMNSNALQNKALPKNTMIRAYYDYSINAFKILNIYNPSVTDSMVFNAENKSLSVAGVQTVDSIAELLTLAKINKRTVFVKSFHSGYGVGGGFFVYNASKDGINNNMVFNGWERQITSNTLTPEMFGAKGKLNDDKSVFASLSADYMFDLAKEYKMDVWRCPARIVRGNDTTIHLNTASGTDTTVSLQIPNRANYSDIDFVNDPNANIAWSYGTCGNDVVLTNIGFYNFIDTNSSNSWGFYLADRNNVTLNSPKFGNNTLADIAIVDNVSNVTINNAINTVDPDGVVLDIEPNGGGNIKNINVNGGKFSQILILENSYQSNGIKGVNITGADIKELVLHGGQLNVKNSNIGKIIGGNGLDYAGYINDWLGVLSIDKAIVTSNLIKDEYLVNLNSPEDWIYYSNDAAHIDTVKRIFDNNGYYTIINPAKNALLSLKSVEKYPLNGFKDIAVMISYAVENLSNHLFNFLYVTFFDDSGAVIDKVHSIKGGRTFAGNNYDWSSETCIINAPLGATKFSISIEIDYQRKTSALKIKKLGFYGFKLTTEASGNFNAVMDSYKTANMSVNYTKQAINYTLAANETKQSIYELTGVALGDKVNITFNPPLGVNSNAWAEVTAENKVTVYHKNLAASPTVVNSKALIAKG